MKFEYDPTKSKINAKKHGISFDQAKLLWKDERHIVVPARSITEKREAIVAELKGIAWTAIYTTRGKAIRIISVRRSRDEEREEYNNR
ncbi:MAG: BrnT family toxin [Chthoniobacterales bacterium]